MAAVKPINTLVLVKGQERYVFLYADAELPELARRLRRIAQDKTLSLTLLDAALLMGTARRVQLQRDNSLGSGDLHT